MCRQKIRMCAIVALSTILFLLIPLVCIAVNDVADEFLYGDANDSGEVELSDLVLFRDYLANFDYDTQTSPIRLSEGADADGNGFLDLRDHKKRANCGSLFFFENLHKIEV